MALNTKNIIVGAARLFSSYGVGTTRPDLTSSAVFPWNVNTSVNSGASANAGLSTVAFLGTTASSYWRELGYTSTGVDMSYEPGYNDVVVDQLLDAARLFQHSLKIVLKTELDEGLFENLNFVWGQPETVINAGSAFATVPVLTASGGANTGAAFAASAGNPVTQLNIVAGALGITPQERTLVFVGNSAGSFGLATTYPVGAASVAVTPYTDVSAQRLKERVYVARRIIQEQTTAHALKRDGATVFPVSFRALPDVDRNPAAGSEYGFLIDRVYGTT